nr:folate-binding protein [Rhizobium sp. Khangiran2]
MPAAHLPERRFLRISGPEAVHFLQNLITTDIVSMPDGVAKPGALLTPQGKILFDFSIWRDGDGFLIETDAEQQDALVRRLTMYKLRAAVEIAVLEQQGATVAWGEDEVASGVTDSRFDGAAIALTRMPGLVDTGFADGDYEALRVEAGVAASGVDYALQDAFPHDILMDLNGGLSFRKGCYVGQEVVSRMQHRGTARRRLVQIAADEPLPPTGVEIIAGGKPAGTLGTVCGRAGLAILRTDRIGAAIAAGTPVLAGGKPVTVRLPAWSGLTFPSDEQEAGS